MLSPREQLILSAVTELYIETGEPVGSKAVCERIGNSCSSATVRNEMSELTELGLLVQPHTSAGRIPSQKGYRYYVDRLLDHHRISEKEKKQIRDLLPASCADPDQLTYEAAQILSDITHCTAVTTSPSCENDLLDHVELLPLSPHILLMVLLTSGGAMQSRPVRTETVYKPQQLETFVRMVNTEFSGKPLLSITPAAFQTAAVLLGADALILAPLFDVLLAVAGDAMHTRLSLEGEENLLSLGTFSQSRMKDLLRFLGCHELLAPLLFRHSDNTAVTIGNEAREDALSETSIVSSKYAADQKSGRIAVIGPIRMDYGHIIPSVEFLAGELGRLLEKIYTHNGGNDHVG